MSIKKIKYNYFSGRKRNILVIAIMFLACTSAGFIVMEVVPPQWLYIVRANNAYHNGFFDDAEVFYKTGLTNTNIPAGVHYNLGNVYYRQERYAEAIQAYQKALLNNDLQKNILANLGNAYYMTGDLYASANAYKKALMIDDTDAAIQQNLFLVLSKINAAIPGMDVNDNKKNKTKEKSKNEGTSQNANEPGDKKEEKIADNNIAGILSLVNRNEQTATASISKLRSKNKPPVINGQDY